MNKFKRLIEKYSNPDLASGWFERWDRRRYPNLDEIADIFYKAARDLKAGRISRDDFSRICAKLFFGAYLVTEKKYKASNQDLDQRIKDALLAFSDPDKKEADKHWLLKKEFHDKYLGFVK